MLEEVILVNENDESVGMMEKIEAHRKGLLHRAFSVFIFNSKGEMLLQQRSKTKYHSPGLWTNTCCSHPFPGEENLDAANRRLRQEMGFSTRLEKIFDFTYRSEFDNGLTEFEYDHVFAGTFDGQIQVNKDEVMDYCFMSLEDVRHSMVTRPSKYTVWFHIAFPLVEKWKKEKISSGVPA